MGMDALHIFRIIAPEFSFMPDNDVEDPNTHEVSSYGVNTYLKLYSDQISRKRFGDSYDKALAYLTAHKLKMNGFGREAGGVAISDSLRVSSYSEGNTSVSFATNQTVNLQTDAEYALTVYGLEFLTLRRNAIVPIISAGEGAPRNGW